MNVSLTPELDRYVSDKVDSGRYTSASEVVREALRLMETRDMQLQAFTRELDRRLAGIDAGEVVDGRTARRVLSEKTASLRKKR
jgi:antitoxin ParD1/3/4